MANDDEVYAAERALTCNTCGGVRDIFMSGVVCLKCGGRLLHWSKMPEVLHLFRDQPDAGSRKVRGFLLRMKKHVVRSLND